MKNRIVFIKPGSSDGHHSLEISDELRFPQITVILFYFRQRGVLVLSEAFEMSLDNICSNHTASFASF